MSTLHAQHPTPDTLNDVMEFDHVIRVHADGAVTSVHSTYAPELLDDELIPTEMNGPDWQLLDGYSGQWGHRGPTMHQSEYIGGRMARDILAAPGLYVAIVAMSTCEDGTDADHDASECLECDGGGTTGDSWAVAYVLD